MKNLSTLAEWKPKKLRNLKMNLNNRLNSYKIHGESAKELQKSHVLYNRSISECADLLKEVDRLLKDTNRTA